MDLSGEEEQGLPGLTTDTPNQNSRNTAIPTVVTLSYPTLGKLQTTKRLESANSTPDTNRGARLSPTSGPFTEGFPRGVARNLTRKKRSHIIYQTSKDMDLPPYAPSSIGFSRYLELGSKERMKELQVNNGLSGKKCQPPFSDLVVLSATTTPTGPYSSPNELLTPFHPDPSPRFPSPEDLRPSNGGSLGELDRRRTREPSRKESRKQLAVTSREKALSLERERELQEVSKPEETKLPQSFKNNYFKPNGVRNNYLGGQQLSPSTRAQPPLTPTPREQEDLVAMGTNWAPPNLHLRSSRGTLGNPGLPTNLSHQLSVTQAPTMSGPRRVGKTPSMSHVNGSRPSMREGDPKYPDPLNGATPSFHQRIAELASLESETIRWERSRKVKKKPKET